MNLLEVITHHGYAVTSIVVFSACCGLPLPLVGGVVDGGCGGAWRVAESWAGDCCARGVRRSRATLLMYLGGRYTGMVDADEYLQVQLEPGGVRVWVGAASSTSAGRGRLLVAKFVPGLAEVSSVLAGSLNMRPRRFLLLDGLGVLLYVTRHGAWRGYVFAPFLRVAIGWVERVGHFTAAMLAGIVVLYVLWVVLSLLREIAASDGGEDCGEGPVRDTCSTAKHDRLLIIADVRSRGYYDPGHAEDQELDSRGSGPAEGGSGGVAGVHAAAAGLRDLSVLLVRARGDEHARGADAADGRTVRPR